MALDLIIVRGRQHPFAVRQNLVQLFGLEFHIGNHEIQEPDSRISVVTPSPQYTIFGILGIQDIQNAAVAIIQQEGIPMVFVPNALVALEHKVGNIQTDSIERNEIGQAVGRLQQEPVTPPADHRRAHAFGVLQVAVINRRHRGQKHFKKVVSFTALEQRRGAAELGQKHFVPQASRSFGLTRARSSHGLRHSVQ